MNNAKLIAVDTDDVLVHITTPWILRAAAHPDLRQLLEAVIGKHYPNDGDLTRALLARPHPYIQDWLTAAHALSPSLYPALDMVYRGDPAFYDDLPPTQYCQAIRAAMSMPGRVAHVHVITHNFDNADPCAESKERWLRRWLGERDRVTIHHVQAGQKKSDVIAEHCPEADSFADDSMKNVVDILLHDGCKPREILIPRMGHNVMSEQIATLAVLRKISIVYYENAL
jgi:hypothetical protein